LPTTRFQLAAFKEVVAVQVPSTDRLVRLAVEMTELRGVGNWPSGVQFAVAGSCSGAGSGSGSGSDSEAEAEADWVFETGLRDPTIVPIFDAAVEAFSEQ
jgi:hypothetical protein